MSNHHHDDPGKDEHVEDHDSKNGSQKCSKENTMMRQETAIYEMVQLSYTDNNITASLVSYDFPSSIIWRGQQESSWPDYNKILYTH